MSEKKLKHLEFIQLIISRLANNSFYVKGWCVTVVAAILGLANKESNKELIAIVIFPILMFWMLDSYFLHQERLFRSLYNKVRQKSNDDIDFDLNTEKEAITQFLVDALWRPSIILFYCAMFLATFIAIFILKIIDA